MLLVIVEGAAWAANVRKPFFPIRAVGRGQAVCSERKSEGSGSVRNDKAAAQGWAEARPSARKEKSEGSGSVRNDEARIAEVRIERAWSRTPTSEGSVEYFFYEAKRYAKLTLRIFQIV